MGVGCVELHHTLLEVAHDVVAQTTAMRVTAWPCQAVVSATEGITLAARVVPLLAAPRTRKAQLSLTLAM